MGIYIEGEDIIYGFHPTSAAAQAVGGEEVLLMHLKARHSFPGTLQDDTAIFIRADELAQDGDRTDVHQYRLNLEPDDFQKVCDTIMGFYTSQEEFLYAFPPKDKQGSRSMQETDNCATFLRRLHLPALPNEFLVGQMLPIKQFLKDHGEPWKPT